MPKEELKKIQLLVGTVVNRQWKVKSKLGEGGCGVVYEVTSLKNSSLHAALKSEPFGMLPDDELLKMEVHVLRKLSNAKHVCKLMSTGKGPNYNFVVMSLLGRALNDLRRACPDRKFSIGTTMFLAIECLEAIRELHDAGFVHRDIKPSNFSLGRPPKQRTIFVYDFGLTRQIITWTNGQEQLRPPRKTVPFKGTVRYASLNVHRLEEYGRNDDLWSLMYSLIEMIVGDLPWQKLERGPAERSKETTEKQLLESSPPGFAMIFKHLKSLNYKKRPDYGFVRGAFELVLKRRNLSISAPLDWEEGGRHALAFKTSGAVTKKDQLSRPGDLKRVCEGITTRCDVDEIAEREFKHDDDDDQGASHVSGVTDVDDTLIDVENIK